MDQKKKRQAVELTAVLLVTIAAFLLCRQAALLKRGYSAIGGEYLLLLLPVLHYIGKSMRPGRREKDSRKPSP